MKRRIRQGTIGIFAGALILITLSGCQKEMTAESLLTQVEKKTADKTMMQTDWVMGIDIAASLGILGEDTTMDIGVDADGVTKTNLTDEISYTMASMSVDLLGTETAQEMEIYTQTADGQTTAYIGMDGEWEKSSAESENTEEDSGNILSAVSELGGSLTLSDEKTERDGVSCYELTSEMSGELLSLLEQMTAGDVTSEILEAEDAVVDLEGMFGSLGMKFALYVDAESMLPVEMVVESTESGEDETESGAVETDSAETEAAETDSAEEEESAEVQIASFTITLKFSYPETETIVIPEEALAAEEISTDSLSGDAEEDLEGLDTETDVFGSLANPVVVKDYGETGETLYDQDGITAAVRRVYTDGDDTAYIDMILTNGSEQSLDFYTLGVCLNDTMTESSLYQTVAAGETSECSVYIPDLASQGISEIGRVRMDLVADSTEDYTRKLESTELSFEITETGTDSVKTDGGARLIYEDDQIAVTAYDEMDEENSGYHTMPICIENKTDQKVAVSSDGLRLGDQEIAAAIYGEMFPHTLYYTSILVDSDSMQEAGITDFQGVEFTLSATEVEDPANVIFSVDVAAYPEV